MNTDNAVLTISDIVDQGSGMVWADGLLAFMIFMVILVNLAVLRDIKIVEPATVAIGRRLMIGGWVMFFLRYMYLLVLPPHDLPLAVPSLIGFFLITLGTFLVTCVRLLHRWDREKPYQGIERRRNNDRRNGGSNDRRHLASERRMTPGDWDSLA